MIFNNGYVQLYHADARQLPIPDESIDCVVTSPPYWGLRDYGLDNGIGLEATPEDFCANMVEVFREVWRVLKPTGTVWMNLGDVYGDKQLLGIPWRVAFALQADGWYLRSDIIWSKPNPMPESVSDRPTKAHEYIFLLTKNPRYYYDADAIREANGHEADWNNYGGQGLITHPTGLDRNKIDLAEGFSQPKVMPNATHPNGRNKRTVWEIATQPYPEAHFATYPEKLVEPCILAGTSEKGVCAECGKPWERITEKVLDYTSRTSPPNKGRVVNRSNGNDKAAHMTHDGFILNRTSTIIRLGWQPTCECNAEIVPATVLDPFVGSGTTLSVAQRLGRRGVGTDLNLEYLALASKRLSSVSLPMNLGV